MWLISENVARDMVRARDSGLVPSADAQQQFIQNQQAYQASGDPRIAVRQGRNMDINVEGVLTKRPSLFAMLFGGGNTAYSDIQAAIAVAQNDPDIKTVRFVIDSPGGEVDGLFDTLGAIESLRESKKVSVLARSAQSAAYAIAATAGPITAQNVASEFGSIGVAVDMFADEGFVSLTNSQSPDKRPDISTPEGRAVIVDHLDDLYDIFVGAIAQGRGLTPSKVTKDFGRGRTLLAMDARSRGMVDKVNRPRKPRGPSAEQQESNVYMMGYEHEDNDLDHGSQANAENMETENKNHDAVKVTASDAGIGENKTTRNREYKMDPKSLRADHPDVYDQILEIGKLAERDRVCSHIVLGRQSGDIELALSAIEEGKEMTGHMQSLYVAAAMNASARSARQQESDRAGVVADGKATHGEPVAADQIPQGDQPMDIMAIVASRMESAKGKK